MLPASVAKVSQLAAAGLVQLRQRLCPCVSRPRRSQWELVRRIQTSASAMRDWPDHRLADQLAALRDARRASVAGGQLELATAAFALTTEALRRALHVSLYDEQLLAGLVLLERQVAEMQTGEGKTFAAALPAVVFALAGEGVHIATANDYLAQRDHQWLMPAYQLLGLSVACLRPDATPEQKRAAYAADITYGADQEFGFDFLRDRLRIWERQQLASGQQYLQRLRGEHGGRLDVVQRPLAVAIVDEVDSVLLDAALSPLVLSRTAQDAAAEAAVYQAARAAAEQLTDGDDYVVRGGQVELTARGQAKIYDNWSQTPATKLRRPWLTYLEQALFAARGLRRDVDYVVRDDQVLLVDEYTGRILPHRQWRDGLHQSVEAKEGLAIHTETCPLVRISKQRYFRRYPHLCGMTGTAEGSQREFWDIFGLRVQAIPPHRPCQRRALPPRMFATEQAKYAAIIAEIQELHRTGRPILVGARTIANTQRIASALDRCGVAYCLLNGTQDAEEAAIVARAGELGAVTIATNMAGRGTDIRLSPEAAALGGLHVIVVQQHDAARIDRQLMGRAARQGDPGSCRVFGSAQDELIAERAPRLARFMQRRANAEGEVHDDLAAAVANVQRYTEWQHYRQRQELLRYDDWLENLLARQP